MQDCEILAGKIRRSGLAINNIYGIPRGGLIPAIILSHLIEAPLLLDENQINSQTLIIDDISDSGKTLMDLTNQFASDSDLKTATLWINPTTTFIPTFHARVNDKDVWIIFPFETIISSKKDN